MVFIRGLSKVGTGSEISFGPQYAQGNFHSIAVNEQQCKQLMNGLVEVKQLNQPRVFNYLEADAGAIMSWGMACISQDHSLM